MALYVLVGPDGKDYPESLGFDADEAWCNGFPIVAYALGADWMQRFWKRAGPSKISARRLGWRVRKCKIVLEEG